MGFYIVVDYRQGKMKYRPFEALDSELKSLIRLFRGLECPVFLLGGIGLAIRKETFYRNHKDFDLGLFIEDFPEFYKFVLARGYDIVKRTFTTRLARDVDLQIFASIPKKNREHILRQNRKMRVAIKPWFPKLRIKGRLDMMDLMLFERTKDGVIACGYDIKIPWADFSPIKRISEESSVSLPNISYKRHFPVWTDDQRMDMELAGLKPIRGASK